MVLRGRAAVQQAFVTALLVGAVAVSAVAQEGGRIVGIVVDQDGSPIEGAAITATAVGLTEEQPSAGFEATTGADGRFGIIGLASGRWHFTAEAERYQPVEGPWQVTQGRNIPIRFALEADLVRPPAPSSGVLAGLPADELEAAIDAANALFDGGDFDAAIDGYQAVLERAPLLTSLHLQIGHAYREKQDVERALEAYRAVPADQPSGEAAQAAIAALESGASRR